MAYPGPYLRLVCSGPLYITEGWSWGLSFAPSDPDVVDRPLSVPTGVRTAIETFHRAVAAPAAPLAMIKLNEIGTDGKYRHQQTVLHDYGTAPITPTGTDYYPPQVALVISLDTAIRRGIGARGRFYVPVPKFGLAGGRLSVDSATGILTEAQNMVAAIHTALPGYRLVVASDTREGRFQEVQRLRVGRVLDTMRSRRTSIAEGYIDGTELPGYTAMSRGATEFGGGSGEF